MPDENNSLPQQITSTLKGLSLAELFDVMQFIEKNYPDEKNRDSVTAYVAIYARLEWIQNMRITKDSWLIEQAEQWKNPHK